MEKLRFFIADGMADAALARFQEDERFEVKFQKESSAEQLLDAMVNSDIIAVRSASKVREEQLMSALEKGSRLKLIIRLGAGVDNIDVKVAKEKGIHVMNTASANALSAAEHTIAMMFAVARNIPQAYGSLKNHEWKRSDFAGFELAGKRLAVVGCGQIGRLVAERALALGMDVSGYDPFVPDVTELEGMSKATHCTALEDALTGADLVTLHLPKVPATEGMINKETISQMKKGAYLFNVARGGLENVADVLAALDAGKLSAYAVDVYEKEPPEFPSTLIDHPKVICTPHLGASTKEAQQRVGLVAYEQIAGFFFENSRRGII